MKTARTLALGAALLLPACARNSAEEMKTQEHVQLNQEVAEAAGNQPVQTVRTACALKYQACLDAADEKYAQAVVSRAKESGAIKHVSAHKRPLYEFVSDSNFHNKGAQWSADELGCKKTLKSCLE